MATVCARPILLVLIGAVSSCSSLHVSVPDPGSPLAKSSKNSLPADCAQKTLGMQDMLADIWDKQAPLFLSLPSDATQCATRCFIDNFPSTPKQFLDCQEGCQKPLTTYAQTIQKIFEDNVKNISQDCTFDDVADSSQDVCDCIDAQSKALPEIKARIDKALTEAADPEGCAQETQDMRDRLANIWDRQAPSFLDFAANATQCGTRCLIDNFPSTPEQILKCQEGCQKPLTTHAQTSQKIFEDAVKVQTSKDCTLTFGDDLAQGFCDCIRAQFDALPAIEKRIHEALTKATAGLR